MTRAVLFGVGQTASALAATLQDKGVDIVGAFSRSTGLGSDLGDHFRLGGPVGTLISNDPERALSQLSADVALIATQTTIASQMSIASLCLDNGLDVLSLAEEGFYPASGARALALELDTRARSAGKSIFFGGVQDPFWHALPLTVAAGAQTIDQVRGVSVSNLDELGPETLAEYPLDLDPRLFAEASQHVQAQTSIMSSSVDALVRSLHLTSRVWQQSLDPVVADVPRFSHALGRSIGAGRTCGMTERTTVETEEGVRLETAFVSEIFVEGQKESVRWNIDGRPSLEVVLDDFPGAEVTAATLVNRIPMVIAAPPGYVTVHDLPVPSWWRGNDTTTRGVAPRAEAGQAGSRRGSGT